MPINASSFQTGFNQILKFGHPIRVRYYTKTFFTGSYDDEISLAISGTAVWESGLTQPIRSERGDSVGLLLEQGKLLGTDQVMYLKGSTSLSGVVIVGIGSPTSYECTIIPEGVTAWNVNGSTIYQKAYIRRLTTGSLYGF